MYYLFDFGRLIRDDIAFNDVIPYHFNQKQQL